MTLLRLLLVLLAGAGHCAIWMTAFNRLSARPRRGRLLMELLVVAAVLAPPLWLAGEALAGRAAAAWSDPPLWLRCYAAAAVAALASKLPAWLDQLRSRRQPPQALLGQSSRTIDVPATLGYVPAAGSGWLWRALPGNESWQLAVERKTLWARGIHEQLAGLRITHLSDLHLTGRVGRGYFEQVVEEANRLQSDLIVLSGDVVDHERCLPWIQPLLGRLQAPLGVYYVLGNHDKRAGEATVREQLDLAGLIPLGGRSLTIRHAGRRILLAGDERPWFGAAPELGDWEQADLRLLLAHTPDCIGWAQRQGFDLVLAGHTHGGQIRLPLIGAIASPSIHGTRYAGGVFDECRTVMHVSRGLSGLHPVRWNCPPELTQLTLTTTCPIERRQQAAVALGAAAASQ